MIRNSSAAAIVKACVSRRSRWSMMGRRRGNFAARRLLLVVIQRGATAISSMSCSANAIGSAMWNNSIVLLLFNLRANLTKIFSWLKLFCIFNISRNGLNSRRLGGVGRKSVFGNL